MKHFEETIRLLEDSALFYIITAGMDGTYTYINETYAKQFAHISGDLLGKPVQITMHPSDMDTCVEVSEKCFESPGTLFPATIRKHDGNGGYIFTQWEYRAILDSAGSPAGIFCIGYNITKFVAEGLQLQHARQKIEKNSVAMKKIMFQQSHLIRAPLSNIMGLTGILDRTELASTTQNVLDMISDSAGQLDAVIREITDIAKE